MRVIGLLPIVTVVVCLAACASHRHGSSRSTAPTSQVTTLRVTAQPADALVDVDNNYFGSARVLSSAPRAIRPGVHTVTVRASGWFPDDREVTFGPGETHLEVTLQKVPD